MEEVVMEIKRAMLPSGVDVKRVMMGRRWSAMALYRRRSPSL